MVKSTRTETDESKLVVDVLIDELARVASMEDVVESKRTQSSFFAMFNEPNKQSMYAILTDCGRHYRMLTEEVGGLRNLKEESRERFLLAPPFGIGGETEKETIENQLSAERSMLIAYENILKMLEKLGPKSEVRKSGVRIVPDKVRPTVRFLIEDEKRHIATVEEILRLFKEKHIHLFKY